MSQANSSTGRRRGEQRARAAARPPPPQANLPLFRSPRTDTLQQRQRTCTRKCVRRDEHEQGHLRRRCCGQRRRQEPRWRSHPCSTRPAAAAARPRSRAVADQQIICIAGIALILAVGYAGHLVSEGLQGCAQGKPGAAAAGVGVRPPAAGANSKQPRPVSTAVSSNSYPGRPSQCLTKKKKQTHCTECIRAGEPCRRRRCHCDSTGQGSQPFALLTSTHPPAAICQPAGTRAVKACTPSLRNSRRRRRRRAEHGGRRAA